jgi:RHS repeat-associated protein
VRSEAVTVEGSVLKCRRRGSRNRAYKQQPNGKQGHAIYLLDPVTDASANIKERTSFDPWGRRRDAVDWEGYQEADGDALASAEKPGYTGHEDLSDVGIIHMNGRLYDPEIGRFLSCDPILQGHK